LESCRASLINNTRHSRRKVEMNMAYEKTISIEGDKWDFVVEPWGDAARFIIEGADGTVRLVFLIDPDECSELAEAFAEIVQAAIVKEK